MKRTIEQTRKSPNWLINELYLVYYKIGISDQSRKSELSINGVGATWKNKCRYLVHITIIPNEFKTSTWRNKIARVLAIKVGKYFIGVRSS